MGTRWITEDKKVVLATKWLKVEEHLRRRDTDATVYAYHFVRKPDYVVVVARTTSGVLFVKEFRHGIDETILNLPMGVVDVGETPRDTAGRELLEETGYFAENLVQLGTFYLAPSFMNTKAHVFLAESAVRTRNVAPDANEDITSIVQIPLSELRDLITAGTLKDLSSSTAILLALAHCDPVSNNTPSPSKDFEVSLH